MTDRYAGYIVTMDQDMREDDAQSTIKAIEHIKGVIRVEPVVTTPELHMARAISKNELWVKLVAAFKEDQK